MAHRLRYQPPLASEPLLSFLGARAIPGVEAFDGRTFRRSMRTTTGRIAVIGLTPDPARGHVALHASIDDASHLEAVIPPARRLLDLDADPGPIDELLARDPALRPSVRSTPGLRSPGTIDGFELAVRAVLGQQVSIRAARTFAGRIAIAAGTPLPPELVAGNLTHIFPTAEQLAVAPLDTIGLTSRRRTSLQRLAQLVADGELDLSGRAERETTLETLLSIPGIGPWTASYVAMRALGDTDAFPASDFGIRAGFEALGLPTSSGAIERHAERWRPWRSYAVMHIWRSLG
jgi:AraC family transcriptional regulator, regulatory protein of adaptative response / DNA-3-methyladenine glycosylase II